MQNAVSELSGQILIAMPTLADPNFWRSVVLLAVHNQEEGAFGLVMNRPLEVPMAEVLRELGRDPAHPEMLPPVLGGGPVDPTHGFVLFETDAPPDDEEMSIQAGLTLSGSTDTLFRLVDDPGLTRFLLFLGYSGWAPGQLEQEIEENSWLVAPFERDLLFDATAAERWEVALRSIGVDPGTLVDAGGASPS